MTEVVHLPELKFDTMIPSSARSLWQY